MAACQTLIATYWEMTYLDALLLKSFDLPKYKVEPVVHKLEIEPHKPHKTSKEKHGDNNG
jgi:hypothetical protein